MDEHGASEGFDIPFGEAEMSLVVLHDEVPPTGKTVTHQADAQTLAALAERFSVEAVEGLRYDAVLMPMAGGCLQATGKVEGRVQQICGVTLEPMWTEISEAFSVSFQPLEMIEAAEEPEDEFDADVPEPIVSGQADIGEAVTQLFAMEVPAYPRKPDASFAGYGQSEDEMAAEDKAASPFAALAALKPEADDS